MSIEANLLVAIALLALLGTYPFVHQPDARSDMFHLGIVVLAIAILFVPLYGSAEHAWHAVKSEFASTHSLASERVS